MSFTTSRVHAGRVPAALLLGLLIAACSSSPTVTPGASANAGASASSPATPSPSPSAAPSATASATASPSSSVSPSSSAPTAPDPAAGLAIAAPYVLSTLDSALETRFRDQFGASAGAFASLIGIGGRQVNTNGALAGYVFVVGFPTGLLSDATYQGMLTGIERGSQVTFATTTISGVKVSSGSAATSGLGAFKSGDRVILLVTPTAGNVAPIATALISANP